MRQFEIHGWDPVTGQPSSIIISEDDAAKVCNQLLEEGVGLPAWIDFEFFRQVLSRRRVGPGAARQVWYKLRTAVARHHSIVDARCSFHDIPLVECVQGSLCSKWDIHDYRIARKPLINHLDAIKRDLPRNSLDKFMLFADYLNPRRM